MAMSQAQAAELLNPEKQLQKSIKAATTVLQDFSRKQSREGGLSKSLPLKVIKEAKALVVLVEWKVAAIVSGTTGKGLIMKRLDDGRWSAPSAVGSEGLGIGFSLGATAVEHIIALFDEDAIATYTGKAKLKFGSDITVAAGPVATSLADEVTTHDYYDWAPPAGAVGWSHSKGVYAAASLENTLVHSDTSDNKLFYGKDVTTEAILSGEVPPPEDVVTAELYKVLAEMDARVTDKASQADAQVKASTGEAAPTEQV